MANSIAIPPSHRALVLASPSEPLKLTTRPTPTLPPSPGTVLIRPLAAGIVAYSKEVFSTGNPRGYTYTTPLVPGPSCIGRVLAVPADAPSLRPGQLVWIDPVVRARDGPSPQILQGAGVRGEVTPEAAALMASEWRHGTLTEIAEVMAESVFPLDEEALGGYGYKMEDLARLTSLMVAYGGLRDVDVRPGETVLVAPATGGFGGAAVQVALALGARVVAMGRNAGVLREIQKAAARAYPSGRLATVVIAETVEATRDEIARAAREVGARTGEVDVFFDIGPPGAAASPHLKAGLLAVRARGRVSLMGGGVGDVAVPYYSVMRKGLTLQGTWMYNASQVRELLRRVETGMLKLGEKSGAQCVGIYRL